MQELIKIKEENGQQLVSARELHAFLNSKQDFTTWIKGRILKYSFEEGVDFTLHKFMEGKVWKHEYVITLDMAKELSMVENNEKGRLARKYFIACEKRLKEVATPKLPATYKEALIELVKTIEEKEKIEEEKNRLIHDNKVYTATEIAKELGFRSARAFNEELKERKIQYKVNGTWILAARYSDKGFQSIKQTELDTGKIVYTRMWTGIGREWLINKVFEEER